MAETQLIYVTLDLRRGLWISEATGAKIVCAYKSDLLDQMRRQGADIWCFEEEFPEAELPKSTFTLLSRALTLNMLRELDKKLKFIVFKGSNKIRRWILDQGWELLAADPAACLQLEDKLHFTELATKAGIRIPESREVLWNAADADGYHVELGDTYIVQGRMGHAGNSTYVKRAGQKLELVDGTRVKITRFVTGATYTLNGYASPGGKIVYGSLWRQLMNVKEWNRAEMGTVGVTALTQEVLDHINLDQLTEELKKFEPLFAELNYVGAFGLDLIWNSEHWYVIECNARLTASVSLQVLQDLTTNQEPMLKLQGEQVGREDHEFRFASVKNEFSQMILRNSHRRLWRIRKVLKSGVYQRGESGDWKLLKRTVNPKFLEPGMIMLVMSQPAGTEVEPGSDYASMVVRGPVANLEGMIDDLYFDFYERVVLGRLIRERNVWKKTYKKFVQRKPGRVFLMRRPIPKYLELKKSLLRPHRQVELLDGEVLKVRARYKDFRLVEKVDKTRGWLHIRHLLVTVGSEEFVRPNKASRDAYEFLKEWDQTPYLLAGNSKRGIDCSAFVQRYFWEVKGIMLPKYSQDQKAHARRKDDLIDMEDEDLIFMRSRRQGIAHVGLVKDGKIWHSSLETGVVEQSLDEVQEKYEIEHLSHLK